MRVLFLILLLWTPSRVLADNHDLAAVLDEIQRHTAAVETISCTFTQEKHLSMFATDMRSTGRFAFHKPDKLRWEYLSPALEGFAVNGDRAVRWTADQTDRRAFSLDDDPVMRVVARQLAAWATFDLHWLRKEYTLELETPAPVTLRLTPRRPEVAALLRFLRIEFSDTKDTVRLIELHEHGDDLTRILFSAVETNTTLDPGLFR